jgi:hypothetical protein
MDHDVFGPVDNWSSQPSQRRTKPKGGPPRKFVDDDSSSDDVGSTPRPRSKAPLNITAVSVPFSLLDYEDRDDQVSKTDYMSTRSITECRCGKVLELPRLELPPVPSTSFAKKKSAMPTTLELPIRSSPSKKRHMAHSGV